MYRPSGPIVEPGMSLLSYFANMYGQQDECEDAQRSCGWSDLERARIL